MCIKIITAFVVTTLESLREKFFFFIASSSISCLCEETSLKYKIEERRKCFYVHKLHVYFHSTAKIGKLNVQLNHGELSINFVMSFEILHQKISFRNFWEFFPHFFFRFLIIRVFALIIITSKKEKILMMILKSFIHHVTLVIQSKVIIDRHQI